MKDKIGMRDPLPGKLTSSGNLFLIILSRVCLFYFSIITFPVNIFIINFVFVLLSVAEKENFRLISFLFQKVSSGKKYFFIKIFIGKF